eukprot:SAG25_NODE_12864_length_274_cov_0.782857_1_plen_40_part_10
MHLSERHHGLIISAAGSVSEISDADYVYLKNKAYLLQHSA